MDEELFSGLKDSPVTGAGYQNGDTGRTGGNSDAGFTSTTANMDSYDYLNMLAEARIVDIAWIR